MTQQNDLIPVLGSAAGGLRFEIVLNKVRGEERFEDSEEPFVILNDFGRFSTVFLARIAMGEDTTVRYFALKTQRNAYSTFGSNIAHRPITNKQITKLWEEERENLSHFSGLQLEVVELFDFGKTFGASQEKSNHFTQSYPVTYCKKKDQYFHPLCPECLSFLRDCRDESLLIQNGLPGYSGSNTRYLYCEGCSSQKSKNSDKLVLYTYSLTPEETTKTKVIIRRRGQLYHDLAKIIQSREIYEKDPAVHKRLQMVFPCYSCDYAKECYSSGKKGEETILAENRLTPFSYYEFFVLPLELLHIHYDEFCDLLGGASWHSFKQSYRNRGSSFVRELIISQIEPFFSSPYQFIFQDDPSGLFALEILRLKMIAFTQLCKGILSIHARCRRPHLDIKPASAMVFLPSSGRDLPSRWNFRVKVIDLAATSLFEPEEITHGIFKTIFWPPHDYQKIYTAPTICETPFGHEEIVNVTVRSINKVENRGKGTILQIEADLVSEEIRPEEYSRYDVMRIILNAPSYRLENLIIWGSKEEAINQGFRIKGVVSSNENSVFEFLRKAKDTTFYDSKVAFYKTYHVPCDLYSIGMMLIRTILVNDENDLSFVDQGIKRIINRLILSINEEKIKDSGYIDTLLQGLLESGKGVFSKNAVFFRREDREQNRNAISDDIWYNILRFAFRLITNIPGFSFCSDHGDYDPNRPEKVMEDVLQELEEINTGLHVGLFGSQVRNREILEVCDTVLKELTEDYAC